MNAMMTTDAPDTDLDAAVDAARAVYDDLDTEFYERSSEARCLVVALIAQEHVLLLGPPGRGGLSGPAGFDEPVFFGAPMGASTSSCRLPPADGSALRSIPVQPGHHRK